MSRPRSKSTSRTSQQRSRNRRKSHGKAAHFVRGLVMEGIGIAVLAFLFLTVQNAPANSSPSANANQNKAESQTESKTQVNGHFASSWADYSQKIQLQIGQRTSFGTNH